MFEWNIAIVFLFVSLCVNVWYQYGLKWYRNVAYKVKKRFGWKPKFRKRKKYNKTKETMKRMALIVAIGIYGIGIICSTIWMFLLPGIVTKCIGVYLIVSICYVAWHKPELEVSVNELSRQQYPQIYEAVEEMKKVCGIKQNVRLFLGEGAYSIGIHNKELYISLDIVELSLMTKKEMQQFMIHEFAHAIYGDLLPERRMLLLEDWWENRLKGKKHEWFKLMFICPVQLLIQQNRNYKNATSVFRERRADSLVMRLGDRQSWANAVGKCAMAQIGFESSDLNVNEALYGGETPYAHQYSAYMEAYKALLAQKEEEWRHIIEVRIEDDFSTHPSDRERIAMSGCETYDVHTQESNVAYKEEMERLLQWKDELAKGEEELVLMFENYQEDYKQDKQNIADFHNAENPYESFTCNELMTIADAFLTVENNKEMAMEIATIVLQKEPTNIKALNCKGELLLQENKEEGIEYLHQSSLLLPECAQIMPLCSIKKYAQQQGKKELLAWCEQKLRDCMRREGEYA